MTRHVIIGAGLTGATAAITLRELSADDQVTLIGAEDLPPYERPQLSKGYLRGSVPYGKLFVRDAAFYDAQRIDTMFGSRADGIDATQRIVRLAGGGSVAFDTLLIATGARSRHPRMPGADLDGIVSLRTVRDADLLRAEMRRGRHAVVVGMGFIGCEVAASLRHEGLDVTAIEPGPAPLVRVLGETVGAWLGNLHQGYGVRTIYHDTVAAFEGDGRVTAVVTASGQRIRCDFAVLGIGVEPATAGLDGSGVRLDNGVVVDEYCRTNVTGIFAAGDVANHYHPVFGRHIRVEHWQNAMRQGANAARNMLGRLAPYDEIPWFWSDQYDANIQYAGYHTSFDDLIVRGRLEDGHFAAFYMNRGVVSAVAGVNSAKDVRRAMPLIRARRPVDPALLRDEAADLRSV